MQETGSPQTTRWRLGDYLFDANTNRLCGDGRDLLLEPKAAALLAYFCQHPGRSIGRDELLSAVWHGQIVSDNSISRVVVLLRKALQDESKARKYIATVPKLGYRLVAEVSGVEKADGLAASLGREQTPSTSLWRNLAIGVVAAGVAVAVFLNISGSGLVIDAGRSIVPLSRLATAQSNGHLASDGQGLLYTATDGAWDAIFLVAEPGAEPVPISARGGHGNFATWAHNGAFVVYQYMDNSRCEIHRNYRNRFADRIADVIYECVPGSYSELSLSPDNATLYFVERATPHSPYGVYALEMNGQTKRRLSQPAVGGYGNHYVDVHPVTGAILLLSDHTPGKTSVYELDPASNSFTLRRTFDYGLDSAIWSHRAGHMVHPSRHPSYQLLESSLSDSSSAVMVSDSRRISSPRRIDNPNGNKSQYSFTSYLFNRDIEISGYPSESLSSAVMDYLPAISNSGEQLAFVSKRSGDSQIWIKHLTDGSLIAIEPPEPGRRFHELAWSADDAQLLANTSTGLLVYSIDESSYLHNITLPLPAYGVGWHNPDSLSFSHFENGQWQAYRRRLDTGETVALDPRWAFSRRYKGHELFIDQDLAVFRNGQELTALAQCARPVWRYQLRLRLDGDNIYCHAGDAVDDLLVFDANMDVTRLEGAANRYEFFSVRGHIMANTVVASSSSDIMQTRTAH